MSTAATATTPLRILALSGSLRQASYSTALARLLAEKATDGVRVVPFLLHEIPFYNEDLDGADKPAAVKTLNDAIAQSDAVLVISPEYNYGIPGVLKNALDWVSRPKGESTLCDKPVGIITSSLALTGGVRAQQQLRDTLFSMNARVVPGPEVVVGSVHTKLQNGVLSDAATLAFMLDAIARLRDEALRLNAAPVTA